MKTEDLYRNLAKRAPAERYEDGYRFDMRHVVGDFIIISGVDDEFEARVVLRMELKQMFKG